MRSTSAAPPFPNYIFGQRPLPPIASSMFWLPSDSSCSCSFRIGPPSQSLGVDPVDPAVMRRPPRKKNAPIITKRLLYRVLFSASIIVFGTLFVYTFALEDDDMSRREQTMVRFGFVLPPFSHSSIYHSAVLRFILGLSRALSGRRLDSISSINIWTDAPIATLKRFIFFPRIFCPVSFPCVWITCSLTNFFSIRPSLHSSCLISCLPSKIADLAAR